MKTKSLKHELDTWYEKICTPDFIPFDPVQFPRMFSKREDIEIAAFLAATIAWGRRDLILRSANKMFTLMRQSPYDFILSGDYKKLKNNNIHRTFFESDLKYFCKGFEHCYAQYGNLEKLFSSASNIWEGIALFREEMAGANKGCYSKHISNPGAEDTNGSACKRLNLALRWLVRKGPVDLGLWKKIKPSSLFIPIDVHVARTARTLHLLDRNSNDKRAVIELTEKLREFCEEDPVKYDFALFGMGVEG
ncbi:MAG: TIGR02757 family protein [Treponema sp.]|nr:TIGR02757 family protein [Treponema sp.]MCL2250825.1 TIGR02757 family protein [Treponema sp.]